MVGIRGFAHLDEAICRIPIPQIRHCKSITPLQLLDAHCEASDRMLSRARICWVERGGVYVDGLDMWQEVVEVAEGDAEGETVP